MNKRQMMWGVLAMVFLGWGVFQAAADTPPKQLKFPLDIKFDTNKADIKALPKNTQELSKLSHELNSYPYAKVEIQGYADATGPADYNDKLSMDRAEAVRQKMISDYKVPADRIHTVAMGEKSPAATNATPQGRQENRRVIATVYRLEPDLTGPEGRHL